MGFLGAIASGLFNQAMNDNNNAVNASIARMNNEANMELAKYNAQWQQEENQRVFDRNVMMWNMQNSYNSPASQMRRLNDAGLNPMLVYGNGSVVGNTTSNVPQLDAAKMPQVHLTAPEMRAYTGWNLGSFDPIGEIMSYYLQKGQLDIQNATVSNIEADTISKLASADTTKWKLGYDKELSDTMMSYQREMLNNLQKRNTLLNQDISLFDYKKAAQEMDLLLKQEGVKLNRLQQQELEVRTKQLALNYDYDSYIKWVQRQTGLSDSAFWGAGGIINRFLETVGFGENATIPNVINKGKEAIDKFNDWDRNVATPWMKDKLKKGYDWFRNQKWWNW